jgi:inosine-uridine nucleoside N-ribohydrolase
VVGAEAATIHDLGVRVWIDTDVGTNPDDGAALLLALAHPALEVVGISTVSGDTGVRAAVARAYVPDRNIPVLAGAGRAATAGAPEPRWLGHEGHAVARSEPGASPGELADAVERAQADVLIALGPLTNVAALLERGACPGTIVAMAGVDAPVWHRGQLVEHDHNTASDPTAATTTHERAQLLLTVPLDVTVQMRLGDRDAAVLASAHERLAHEIAAWLGEAGAITLHDPLAVLAAVPEEHAGIGLELAATGPGRVAATRVDGGRAVRRVMQLIGHATEPR